MSDRSAANRLAWIDLLRGLAVVGMIETHVVNVFLNSGFDDAGWRAQLSFFNGLVAPAFLWIAGYIQGRSIRRSHELGRPVATAARWRRLGFVAALSFLLHIPWHFWGVGDFGLASWQHFFQIDVLSCLGVSLGVLLLAGHLPVRWFDAVSVALLGFFVLGAPMAAGWHTGWPMVDGWLNRSGGALFPLFPWLGFVAAGSLASRWKLDGWIWPVLAVAMAWGGYELASGPFTNSDPFFFVERLGWLLGLILVIKAVSRFTAPAWLQLAGRESLLVYMLHLILLHTLPAGGGITWDRKIGPTLSLPAVAMVFVGLLSVCLLAAWFNEGRKARGAERARERRESGPEPVSA